MTFEEILINRHNSRTHRKRKYIQGLNTGQACAPCIGKVDFAARVVWGNKQDKLQLQMFLGSFCASSRRKRRNFMTSKHLKSIQKCTFDDFEN